MVPVESQGPLHLDIMDLFKVTNSRDCVCFSAKTVAFPQCCPCIGFKVSNDVVSNVYLVLCLSEKSRFDFPLFYTPRFLWTASVPSEMLSQSTYTEKDFQAPD